MTTWEKIAAVLSGYGLKKVGREEWRSNRPWAAKSDSMGLTIKVLPDGEYGAYKDHVADEGGSLYQLAERLGVELPERAAITPTKRGYTGLADYAEAHGAPVEAFSGWKEIQCNQRPALHFVVDGQDRYRFIDGAAGKENFYWKKGSHPALYGWARAVEMARKSGRKPVYVNGAATVRVGQWYGIPAFTVEGGEHAIPDAIADQLAAEWDGEFIFALDSDYTGQKAMYGSVAKLTARGRRALNADLTLMDRGDLCDFRKLYGDETYAELERRARPPKLDEEPLPALGELAQQSTALEKAAKAALTDPREEMLKTAERIGAQAERVQEALAPPRVLELHELADRVLNPSTVVRRWPQLPIPELAALVGELEPELYVIYGAPNMGKSWVASSFAAALVRTGSGLLITTETKPDKFFKRMVSYTSRIPLTSIESGSATADQVKAWHKAAKLLSGHETRVMDLSSPTGRQVHKEAERAKKDIGLDWLVVDSATRMRGLGEGIYERASHVANTLQDIAREFDIPVIVTSQVGRDVAGRGQGNHHPRMEDAYGSGVIEQNAGVVLGLYRHDYYVVRGLETPDPIAYPENTARLILLKHRNKPIPAEPWVTVKAELGCGFYSYPTKRINLTDLSEGKTA